MGLTPPLRASNPSEAAFVQQAEYLIRTSWVNNYCKHLSPQRRPPAHIITPRSRQKSSPRRDRPIVFRVRRQRLQRCLRLRTLNGRPPPSRHVGASWRR